MKKTSILLASTIMILAVIVAIVGVTAAWFGNQYIYNEVIDVSSANPENGEGANSDNGNDSSAGN